MNFLKYISIILAVFCTTFFMCCGQVEDRDSSKKDFSKKEIEEDFNELTNIIETKVPSPFYYSSREKYDSVKKYLKKHIPDSASLNDIYKTLYTLVQTLNDAHFSLYLPDNYFSERIQYFPFKVLIVGNKLFVKENCSSEKRIERGSEIISINSIPVETIVAAIGSCNFKLPNEAHFFEEWNETVFYKRLFILFNVKGTFTITLSKGKSFKVNGISGKLLRDSKKSDNKPIFKILDNEIGYLKIPSLIWNKNGDRENFDRSIDSAFMVLQSVKINKLIIDIRDNPGGSSILAKDVLDYIYCKPYTLSEGEVDMEKDAIKETIDTSLHTPTLHSNRYNGATILLNNVLTYSSAHMMQAGFQYYKMGQTIGEISSEPLFITGEVSIVSLKNSHLAFNYPTSNFILPGFNKLKKTFYTPDVIYMPTLTDRLSDKDILLEKAKNMFNK